MFDLKPKYSQGSRMTAKRGKWAGKNAGVDNGVDTKRVGKEKPIENQWVIRCSWWRRRESNPRPKVLYSEFYILSLVDWI